MDLATSIGICLTALTFIIVWRYVKDVLDTYDAQKAQLKAERAARHPILTQIFNGIIVAIAFQVWNRSHNNGSASPTSSNDSNENGRSVYDDLNM